MVFNNLYFLFVFLPISLLLYYVVPGRFRSIPLLIVSLLFFSWGEPTYLILIAFSIVFNFLVGLQLDALKTPNEEDESTFRNVVMVFAIVLNLFILCFYKYYGFLIQNINAISGLKLQTADLPLPIGISFYTFMAISYVLDVYNGKEPAQKNILKLAVYISFFPKLSSGPIVRYTDMSAQLDQPNCSISGFTDGVSMFIIGLAKKVLLADVLGASFATITGATTVAALSAWLGVLLYGLQLYFDFSGYSDMAIGISRMFGFEFSPNFNYPYQSKSIGEFWNRWHISLANWFKNYLYFPLGGNRGETWQTIRNIVVVWLCTGFWHGADWSFVLWGLYHCAFILLEKYVLVDFWKKVPNLARTLITGFLVMFAWPLFFSGTIGDAIHYYASMFALSNNGFYNSGFLYYLGSNIVLIVIGLIGFTPIVKTMHTRLCYTKGNTAVYISVAILLVLFVLSIASILSATYTSFLYFKF